MDSLAKKEDSIQIDDMILNTTSESLVVRGIEIGVTSCEYKILEQVFKNPGRIIPYQEFIGEGKCKTHASLKVHIHSLRKKIHEAGGLNNIDNVRKRGTVIGGYALNVFTPRIFIR